MRDTRTSEEIAAKIAERIIEGYPDKRIFYSDVWNRVVSEVGTGTRKSQRRFFVAALVDQKLKAAGVRQHS